MCLRLNQATLGYCKAFRQRFVNYVGLPLLAKRPGGKPDAQEGFVRRA
jgi:hypothetical protein